MERACAASIKLGVTISKNKARENVVMMCRGEAVQTMMSLLAGKPSQDE
jgi:hypothetical protein